MSRFATRRSGAFRYLKGVLGILVLLGVATAVVSAQCPEPTPVPLWKTGFEPAEGYSIGNLNGQNGWVVNTGTANVSASAARSGVQGAQILSGGEVSRDFSLGAQNVVWLDMYVKASPATEPAMPSSPRSAVLFVDAFQGVMCLNGNGANGGTWVSTGVNPPSGTWFRVSIRLNFSTKKWDCYINQALVLSNLGFHSNTISSLTGLTVRAQATGDTQLDDILISADAPLGIGDADRDGIADIVEGNPPAAGRTNKYLPDSDGDGLWDGVEDANRNGVRDAGETNARNKDTDGDGVIDGIEVKLFNSDPLDPGSPAFAGGDADNDNLPDLFDTNPSNRDQDGDKVTDGYEVAALSFEAVSNANLKPPIGDVNGDGVITNVDALAAQSFFLELICPGILSGQGNTDVDRDGFIGNVDALIMQSVFLSLMSAVPL